MSIETFGSGNILSRSEIMDFLRKTEILKWKGKYIYTESWSRINNTNFSCFCIWEWLGGRIFISALPWSGKYKPCLVYWNTPVSWSTLDEAIDAFFNGVIITDVAISE